MSVLPLNDENIHPVDIRGKVIQRAVPNTKRVPLSTISGNFLKSVSARKVSCNSDSNRIHGKLCDIDQVPPDSKLPFSVYEEDEVCEFHPENMASLYKADLEELSTQSLDDYFLIPNASLVQSNLNENHLYCPLYSSQIYNHLQDLEKRFHPSPNYMKKQPDISFSMRSKLVDWLIEVADEYKMHSETLYRAISYTDRFLSVMSVLRCKLQLVGTACLYVAAKFEEVYPPEVTEFVYITDDTYTKKQVLRMEHLILKILSFDLSAPTAYTFLEYFCSAAKIPENIRHLSEYLCELTLLEASPFLKYFPSQIASAALCLANFITGQAPWNIDLEGITGYNINNFRECIENIFIFHQQADVYPQQALREKYRSSRFSNVAEIPAANELVL